MKTKLLFTIFTITILFSCSKEDDIQDDGFDGSIEDIRAFYNDDFVDALEELGFSINTGNTPPNIEGSYFAKPLILKASSIESDNLGHRFNDYTVNVSNQNNENLTIDYYGEQGVQSDEGAGSFISGSNGSFSIFLIVTSTNKNNETADSAIAISGSFMDDGIKNLQLAYMMLDNKGNPSETWIPNNAGRLLYDSDYFSEKQ